MCVWEPSPSVPVVTGLKWLAVQSFMCQPVFVFQDSKGNQATCCAYMQDTHYLLQIFHAQPLGNAEWQET